jgi:hypothetical protein
MKIQQVLYWLVFTATCVAVVVLSGAFTQR